MDAPVLPYKATHARLITTNIAAHSRTTGVQAPMAIIHKAQARKESVQSSTERIDTCKRPLIQPERLTRRRLLAGGMAASVLLPCGCPRPAAAESWGYGDASGPKTWGGTCTTGGMQSPIDLPLARAGPMAPKASVLMDYSRKASLQVVNTGHGTMQVNVPTGSCCTIGDDIFDLVQWHFHSPSEHAVASRREAMEVHLVHKNRLTGNLLVLGVLLRRGAMWTNPALQFALDNAPRTPLATVALSDPVDLQAMLTTLLPPVPSPHYLHYDGSLTTPPCSERVTWYVFLEPGCVADSQILDFQVFAGGQRTLAANSRPLQAINGRQIDSL